jgi:hypothetical protein
MVVETELVTFIPNIYKSVQFWSEQSACAAWVALQMGCMANIVATINNVIFSFSPPQLPFLDFYLT